jgi:hypothetical protein
VPAVGLLLVMASHWAYENWIAGGEVVAVLLVVLGSIAAAAAVARLTHAPVAGLTLVAAWLLLGGAMLHATASAAYGGRTEILTGQRTRVESAAIVRGLEAAAQPGTTVWVERRLWPALAWPLRERAVARFVETPPDVPAAVVVTGDPRVDPGDAGTGVPVAERWAPSRWDLLGILRWWVHRTPWGTTDVLRGAVSVSR